jgi:hypothetical protein
MGEQENDLAAVMVRKKAEQTLSACASSHRLRHVAHHHITIIAVWSFSWKDTVTRYTNKSQKEAQVASWHGCLQNRGAQTAHSKQLMGE